jgi:very-short-patch-repair endonuclease
MRAQEGGVSGYLREAAKALEMCVDWCSRDLAPKCESPIEIGMLQGFLALHLIYPGFRIDGLRRPFVSENYEAKVFIQHVVANYRLDFAVHVTNGTKSAWIAVECDGHDFHERTRDQAKRDKRRDRFLVGQGFRVLRFTGSEIYENSFACAVSVWEIARKIHDEWRGESGAK